MKFQPKKNQSPPCFYTKTQDTLLHWSHTQCIWSNFYGKNYMGKKLTFFNCFWFFCLMNKICRKFFLIKKKIDWNFKQHKTKRQYIFGSLVRRINTHTYTVAQNKRGKMMLMMMKRMFFYVTKKMRVKSINVEKSFLDKKKFSSSIYADVYRTIAMYRLNIMMEQSCCCNAFHASQYHHHSFFFSHVWSERMQTICWWWNPHRGYTDEEEEEKKIILFVWIFSFFGCC